MNIGTIVEFFESMVKSSPMTPNNGNQNKIKPIYSYLRRIFNYIYKIGAYGGDLSGGAFNPIEFIKKPQVGLRFITCVSFI